MTISANTLILALTWEDDTPRPALVLRRLGERLEDRMAVLEAIWQVVLADGRERETELNMIDSTRLALGLSEAESNAMRASALNI